MLPYKDRGKRLRYARDYNRRHYADNQDKRRAQVAERRRAIKNQYEQFKRTLSCIDCGFSGEECPWAIEFDHLDPVEKRRTIARMVSDGRAWDSIMAEVEKCEPVCSNCHRVREHQRFLDGNPNNVRRSRHPEAMTENVKRRMQEKRVKRERLKEEYGGSGSSPPGPDGLPLAGYTMSEIHERIRRRDEIERQAAEEEE